MQTKFSLLFAWLAVVGALLFLFGDVLFGFSVTLNGDVLHSFLPFFEYVRSGGSLVMQNILSGFPTFVSPMAGWFNVFIYLFLHLGTAHWYGILTVVSVLLTPLATYFYARIIGLTTSSAIFAGALFTFSGQLMLWAGTYANANYYFVLPAALYAFELFKRRGVLMKGLIVVLLGILLGYGWLASHVQFVVYIHTFLCVYVFVSYSREQKWLRAGLSSLRFLSGVFIISFLVGLPQITATLQYQEVTARSQGVQLSEYYAGAYLPQDALQFVLPFSPIPLLPAANPNLYMGVIALLLIPFALLLWRHFPHWQARFFGGVFIFSLLASIKYSPFGWFLHQIPLFDSFREAPRIMFLGQFGAALLVGFAADLLSTSYKPAEVLLDTVLKWGRRVFLYVWLPIVCVASSIALLFSEKLTTLARELFVNYYYASTSGLPLEHYFSALDSYISSALSLFSITNRYVFSFIVIAVVSYFVLKNRTRFSRVYLVPVLVVLLSFDIAVSYVGRFATIDASQMEKVPATVTYIQQQKNGDPFRVFSVLPGFTLYKEFLACGPTDLEEGFAIQRELIEPNSNVSFGIDVIDGYDNFMPMHVSDILAYVGSEQTVSQDRLANSPWPLSQRVAAIADRKGLLQMMNTRFVVSIPPIDDASFSPVFSTTVGECRVPVSVYELQSPWPRYFFTDGVEYYDGTLSDLDSRLRDDGTPRIFLTSFEFEEHVPDQPIPLSATYGYDTISIPLELAQNGFVMVGNAWLPGWEAYLDGVQVPILRSNFLYMAVAVDSSHKELLLRYKKPAPNHPLWKIIQ